jgi:hypothetical protein
VSNGKEQERIEGLTEFVIEEERRVDQLVKTVQRREHEELPSRMRHLSDKKRKLEELMHSQSALQYVCFALE